MFYWSQIPFVRICIPFLLGIIIQNQFDDLSRQTSLIGLTCSILLLFLSFLSKSYANRYWFGVSSVAVFLFFGSFISLNYNFRDSNSRLNTNENIVWEGEVLSSTKLKGKNSRLTCLVKSVFIERQIEKKLKVMVFLNDSMIQLKPGDCFFTKSKFQDVKKNSIPNQFDYSSFLNGRLIYYQTYLNAINGKSKVANVTSIAAEYREQVISLYQKAGLQENNLGVLIALTLGSKDFLDVETKAAFAHAGAMHILAVSGLHVGIVFLLFSSLFKLFPKTSLFNFLKVVLLLAIIWGFAVLTGFSPSVQRAACMFSIVALSKAINRSSHILNSIFGSAFLLLLLNPNAILEVGFQLSYAAVLGIVLLHPIMYSFFARKNKFFNWILGVLIVSFAAQLATLPFTLYYFHQFPNWFLLVNLLVIPISFVLVSLSLLLIVSHILFSNFLGINYLIDFFIELLHFSILQVEEFPYPYTSGIWIDLISACLLGIFVVVFIYWINYARSKLILVLLSIAICLCLIEIREERLIKKQHLICIYPYSSYPLAYVMGSKAELFTFFDTLVPFEKMQIINHMESIGVDELKFINPLDPIAGFVKAKQEEYSVLQRGEILFLISKKKNFSLKPFKKSKIENFLVPNELLLFNENQFLELKGKLILTQRIASWNQSKIDSLFPNALQLQKNGFFQLGIN